MLAEVNLPNINGLSLKCDFVLHNAIEQKFFSDLLIALKELFSLAIESPLQFDKML